MKHLLLVLTLPLAPLHAENPTWISPAKALAEDPDFAIQGEYGGKQAAT